MNSQPLYRRLHHDVGALAREITRTPVAQDPTLRGPESASIVQIYGPEIGRRYLLARPIVIGREPTSDIPVDLPGVSRSHVRLFKRGGRWLVADLGSAKGTFVGGSFPTNASSWRTNISTRPNGHGGIGLVSRTARARRGHGRCRQECWVGEVRFHHGRMSHE